MLDIIVIAHNLRSSHNIGSLFRTAAGTAVSKMYLSGYSPYPLSSNDERLPHLASKIDKQITKTALGAEKQLAWEHTNDIAGLIAKLKVDGYMVIGLEQNISSIALPAFKPPHKLAILLGRELDGIEQEVLAQCDKIVEIPMFGQKESFNVVQAAAMALYHCRFMV